MADIPEEAVAADTWHTALRAFWEPMEASGFSWSRVVDEALRKAVEAAAPLIAGHAHDLGYLQGVSEGTAAERERVRQLANDHEAHCSHCDECREPVSFADLLEGGDSNG